MLQGRDARVDASRRNGASLREIKNPTLCFNKAIQCDPLEYWAVVEKDGFEVASKNRGLKAQQLLECVSDYWGIGLYDEVIALCDAARPRPVRKLANSSGILTSWFKTPSHKSRQNCRATDRELPVRVLCAYHIFSYRCRKFQSSLMMFLI